MSRLIIYWLFCQRLLHCRAIRLQRKLLWMMDMLWRRFEQSKFIKCFIISLIDFYFTSSDRSSDTAKLNNKVNKLSSITPSPTPPSSTSSSKREIACQTLSTGDIVMMKVHFEE